MSPPVVGLTPDIKVPSYHPMEPSTASMMGAGPTTPSSESGSTHRETNQSSIHTNSTVTIRLSDCTIVSSEGFTVKESSAEAPINQDITGNLTHQAETDSSDHTLTTLSEDSNADANVLEAEINLFQRAHRMSTISMPSIAEEGDRVPGTGSVRSRSDSSGTLSSTGSAQVDWDSLDKSEEAAPRDEGSDEVNAST